MKQIKPSRSRNYVPHAKWGEVREFDTDEEYLRNLSTSVTAACNRFFVSRGQQTSLQMSNSRMFNSAQKTSA